MAKKFKKILALDFDGVIHSYESGWQGARNIPDPPVPGAFEWIERFIRNYCTQPEEIRTLCPELAEGDWEVHIFSSRSHQFGGRRAMKKWMLHHGFFPLYMEVIRWPARKPPAAVTIDDRALTFTGRFPYPDEIVNFHPWNKGGNKTQQNGPGKTQKEILEMISSPPWATEKPLNTDLQEGRITMASRATRRALAVISLARAIADSIEESYKNEKNNKTAMNFVKKIRDRCQKCFALWPDQLSDTEIKRIHKHMEETENLTENNQAKITMMTSLVLALLDDLRRKTNPDKHHAIDKLISVYRQVHRHYDRRLDKWEDYEAAAQTADKLEGKEI
ncbi:MAG: hypothetical protein ACOCQ0_01330 [Desulfosalsimonas sp.]